MNHAVSLLRDAYVELAPEETDPKCQIDHLITEVRKDDNSPKAIARRVTVAIHEGLAYEDWLGQEDKE